MVAVESQLAKKEIWICSLLVTGLESRERQRCRTGLLSCISSAALSEVNDKEKITIMEGVTPFDVPTVYLSNEYNLLSWLVD